MIESGPEPRFEWLRFVQFDPFLKFWRGYDLADEDLRRLELTIMRLPTAGRVIPGTGGVRKIRFASGSSSKGKRSSYRVLYVFFQDYSTVLLLTIYSKAEQTVLKPHQRRLISDLVEGIKKRLDAGDIR